MKILVDTREQRPFTFTGNRHYANTCTALDTLPIGDYSLPGLKDKVAVERKSLPDLIQCLGKERDRFERELARAKGLDAFAVVVEATWADIAMHDYQSKFDPHAAGQSLAAFMARYKFSVIFGGSVAGAEYFTWSFLRQFLQTHAKEWQVMAKAHGPKPWENWGDADCGEEEPLELPPGQISGWGYPWLGKQKGIDLTRMKL